MPWTSPDDRLTPEEHDRFLSGVRERAASHRRRRRMVTAGIGGIALVLLAATSFALASGGGHPQRLHSVGQPPPMPPTTVGTEVTSTTQAPATTVVPPTVKAPTAVTTTTLACRDSMNPACGPFRWDPQPPPNQPLTVAVTFSPARPRPGETVQFHFVGDDPDASSLAFCGGTYGDGQRPSYGCGRTLPLLPAPYGPWTPPSPQPGHLDQADPHFAHQYAAAGTYTATFNFESNSAGADQWHGTADIGALPDPYASTTAVTVIVPVSGQPVATSTSMGG